MTTLVVLRELWPGLRFVRLKDSSYQGYEAFEVVSATCWNCVAAAVSDTAAEAAQALAERLVAAGYPPKEE